MIDYKVQLDVYNGPLDLLLYLIRRDEIDVYDIPIARVMEQYTRYCETIAALDPNLAGDFLVMAATLMEIKSRLLLPRPPDASDDAFAPEDPRSELVRQLLEYKRFKDASMEMSRAAALQSQSWPRGLDGHEQTPQGEIDLDEVQVWDLVAAFNQILAATGRGPVTHDVIVDDTPISLHAADIVDRLVREGSLPFQRLFAGRTRAEMVGLFLALLELIRKARIRAVQHSPFAPIELELLSAEPIELSDEWDRRPIGDEAAPADASAVTEPDGVAESLEIVAEAPPDSGPGALRSGLPLSEDDALDELEDVAAELEGIRTEFEEPPAEPMTGDTTPR